MAARDDIRAGMQVLGSDGGMIGRAVRVHGDHLHLEPDAPEPGATEHMVPLRWVKRVDEHVHLDREAALVRDTWRTGEAAGAVLEPPHGGMGRSWIVWLIGAVLLLIVIVLGIRGCGYAGSDTPAEREGSAVDAPRV